jgi:hypothetical protein
MPENLSNAYYIQLQQAENVFRGNADDIYYRTRKWISRYLNDATSYFLLQCRALVSTAQLAEINNKRKIVRGFIPDKDREQHAGKRLTFSGEPEKELKGNKNTSLSPVAEHMVQKNDFQQTKVEAIKKEEAELEQNLKSQINFRNLTPLMRQNYVRKPVCIKLATAVGTGYKLP